MLYNLQIGHSAGSAQGCVSKYSLGRDDVTLPAKGKIAENTVYACVLLSAHTNTHDTKGKKGTISRLSDQANGV